MNVFDNELVMELRFKPTYILEREETEEYKRLSYCHPTFTDDLVNIDDEITYSSPGNFTDDPNDEPTDFENSCYYALTVKGASIDDLIVKLNGMTI